MIRELLITALFARAGWFFRSRIEDSNLHVETFVGSACRRTGLASAEDITHREIIDNTHYQEEAPHE